MDKFVELENKLDSEINAYIELDNYLTEKKALLIKGDVKNLETIDLKLLEFNRKIQQIQEERKLINKEFGSEFIKLSSIIDEVEDYNMAERLKEKREKIIKIIKNIKKQNEMNNILIEHSLKMIDGTVQAIATALNPIGTTEDDYTKDGKLKVKTMQNVNSSIIKEA